MAQAIKHPLVKVKDVKDNEDKRVLRVAMHCMARPSALLLVALTLCAQPGGATASSRGLRGHPHGGHLGSLTKAPLHGKSGEHNPLYEDFLHMMHNAAGKALKDQNYDDFLHVMKTGAEKAYKQQVGSPSYDQFLVVMKKKADHAYHEQVELPSYTDFLVALKESSLKVLKKPTPSYGNFLTALQDGAEEAMQKRVFHELEHNTIAALSAHYRDFPNPFKQGHEDAKKVENQMQGKATRDDHSKLREELRALQAEKARHKKEHEGGALPPHLHKPLMSRINALRTQLCWQRPNLWQHQKCLRFLGLHCMKESTGEGICTKFTKEANEKCEKEDDPRWRDDYCALGEALSDTYGEDQVEEEQNEAAEGADDLAEQDGAGDEQGSKSGRNAKVGSDEDLEGDLEEEDEKLKRAQAEAVTEEGEDEIVEDGAAGGKAGGKDGAKGKAGKAGAKGKGGADAATTDTDGDGVVDSEDAFAKDASESKDTDGDGIGDNKDGDIDGDGHDNAKDAFPTDKAEFMDSDRDGVGDNADKDRDGDKVANDKDKFPTDPTEWKDSDGDGVGDNKDHYPFNPNCHSQHEPCNDLSKHGAPKPNSPEDPTSLDMDAMRPLPEQGYSEALAGAPVNHNNYYTYTSDWQDEWPAMPETEKQTMGRICKEHPRNIWCHRFKNHDAHFR